MTNETQDIEHLGDSLEKTLLVLLADKILPKNKGGKTNKIDRRIKEIVKNHFTEVKTDPNGSQRAPDLVIDGAPVELKNSNSGMFMFNDGLLNESYIYVFTSQEKIFITKGSNIEKQPSEYIQDVDKIRDKYKQRLKENETWGGHVRQNLHIKSSMIKSKPKYSVYKDGKLWELKKH